MKRYNYIGCLLAFAGILGACSSEETWPEQNETGLTFQVHTRTTPEQTTTPDDANQHTHLYVAERLQEHSEALHCAPEHRYTLTGGRYELNKLFGQWYKFAFVCVPKWKGVDDVQYEGGENLLTEEIPAEHTCNFNKLLIDYNPVLRYQKAKPDIAATQDLNIYRKVIERWINPDKASGNNTEDVVMQRITGELVLDMGIPADQFPKDLEFIQLTLKDPSMQVYVHDEAKDGVITKRGGGDMVYTLDFSKLDEKAYRTAMESKQLFHLCLLPEILEGYLLVKYKNTSESLNLSIGEKEGDTRIEIRKNQITTVLYHGMNKNEFEVRYAGFNDDAQIGVGDDNWNGWLPKNK